MAHARVGRRRLSLGARIRLLHALGYVIDRTLFLRLLPPDVRAAVMETTPGFRGKDGAVDPNDGMELPPERR
jgi:hypothetical protein